MVIPLYTIEVVHPHTQYSGTMFQQGFDVEISLSTRRHANYIEQS